MFNPDRGKKPDYLKQVEADVLAKIPLADKEYIKSQATLGWNYSADRTAIIEAIITDITELQIQNN